ncbi:hypothetical protein [Kribbella sp. NPDC051718]|uniref:hypothetical protein n=1 Tax=Kribbella sp. NPDC051718 TaxID=3155168 RepID=UPI003432260C
MNRSTTVHSPLAPDLDGDVEVRTGPDGAVVIGPPPVGAAGLSFIAVTGGLLAVDPMAPHGPGQLRISDPSQACAVEAIYGAEVAAAVNAAGDRPIRLPLMASPSRDALVSLGVLRWLAARCPIALDRPLLAAEENILTTRLGDLLDEDHTRGQALLDSIPSVPPAVEPGRAWAVIGELSPRGAPVMGKDDSLLRRGWGPVDWDRTSPTATSRAEDAVSWRILARAGGDLLTVVVRTFPPSPYAELLVVPDALPPPPELQATLHSSAWPEPLAVVELTLRPENGALMGSGRLDPVVADKVRNSQGSALSVEVESRGIPQLPRRGAEAMRAAAVRWATRGLCCLRLASVAPAGIRDDLTTIGTEALAFAARRYTELPDSAAAAQCFALEPTAVGATLAEIWYAAAHPADS